MLVWLFSATARTCHALHERRERFARWNMAKIAIFYPAPFDPRVPQWAQNFAAYVRAAQLVKSLPEVPESQSEKSERGRRPSN